MLDGKAILITGGTGSFGRLYVQTILKNYNPLRVVVFSRDETKQFEMQQQEEFQSPVMRFLVGDVRDYDRLRQALRGIDYVIHTAAIKQVATAEYNPMECIKTNILGAANVINAAIDNEVEKVIALSTDKAAYPNNLYGATKLASDKLFVAANNMAGGHRTRFAVSRYGNVVGSRGSVVPYFKKLLADGVQELPVTHPAMTRFWSTLQDGVHFVLKNFRRMKGGEIFVPKLPSMRIIDLCESLAPGMSVKVIGIRPGEKLHEVMCPGDDSHLTLEFEDHFVIRPSINFVETMNYCVNNIGETGIPVEQGFEYNSRDNSRFLSVEELRALNDGITSKDARLVLGIK